jgi:hypothetical protein
MKHFQLLLLLITSLGSASSYAYFTNEHPSPQIHKKQKDALSKIDVLGCLNKGGVIKGVCMMSLPACVETYTDANKACTDSKECSGKCLVKEPFVDAGTVVIGSCSIDNNVCGCFQTVKSGVAQHALCVD